MRLVLFPQQHYFKHILISPIEKPKDMFPGSCREVKKAGSSSQLNATREAAHVRLSRPHLTRHKSSHRADFSPALNTSSSSLYFSNSSINILIAQTFRHP